MTPKRRTPTPPKRPATRAEQKLETRERLRKAAWELFTTAGFDATTTKEIADRAGVAAGTVFVHASDKGDLLFLVMHERLAATVDRAMATLPKGPLVERLLHVFRALFEMYGEHPTVAAAFVRNFPGAKGPNARRMDELTFGFLLRLAEIVREAKESGEVDADIDFALAGRNVFAVYFFALLGWIGGYVSLEDALDPGLRSSLELQIRGLRPVGSRPLGEATGRGRGRRFG